MVFVFGNPHNYYTIKIYTAGVAYILHKGRKEATGLVLGKEDAGNIHFCDYYNLFTIIIIWVGLCVVVEQNEGTDASRERI